MKNKEQKIIIIGNTNAAEILFGFMSGDTRYDVIAFSVHKEFITKDSIFDVPVVPLENVSDNFDLTTVKFVMGIGYSKLNSIREELYFQLKKLGGQFENFIHPSAIINKHAKLGEAIVVLPNAVIEPFASVGNNSYICSNTTVAHHSKIGNHVWIASHTIISGEATIGNNTFIGVGSTVVNQVIVEEKNILGAGAMITKDTKPNEVYLSRNSEKHRFDSLNYSMYFWKE